MILNTLYLNNAYANSQFLTCIDTKFVHILFKTWDMGCMSIRIDATNNRFYME